ncbi:FAD-dependent oxidoreductase [Pantoea sp. BAV 3049]|uniref:FAD-dependent oxidoreductase n=1 Tax=Pantoea sp. BAV 3049 TaxID=2654188 RepID=UPI00131EB34C|nr:FAD-dependent oxidoreductase [Pantoea sp. BAV 3049]
MSYQNAIVLQDLPQQKPVRVPIGDTGILLIRVQDEVKAYQAKCPHSGAPLEQGAIVDGRLICPWHKATFKVSDGSLCEPLALSDLKRYPVRVENGMVQVNPHEEPPLYTFQADQTEPVFVIAGSGAAGAAAAWTLRREGFKGKLILVDRESEAPYDRTVLTKFVPSGKMKISEVPPLLKDDFNDYAEWKHGDIEQLDTRQQQLRFADGSTLKYDKLLIATGGIPQRPDLEGKALFGVHVLRSIEQADTLLKEVDSTSQLVIVGNSFIGMELASALRSQDVKVQVIARDPLPFKKQFGEQLAKYFRELHEEKGVEFIEGEVAELKSDNGHVSAVQLKSGKIVPADVVLLATGVAPGTGFIHDIPLNDDGSLSTNLQLEVTSNVWAAGDIAKFPAPQGEMRIEHWRVAQQQGRTAAKNMLGKGQEFDRVPFFWTAQFGTRYEYLGHAEEWDDFQLFGSLKEKKFVALYGQKGQLAAVSSCGLYTFTAGLVAKMQQPLSMQDAAKLAEEALG